MIIATRKYWQYNLNYVCYYDIIQDDNAIVWPNLIANLTDWMPTAGESPSSEIQANSIAACLRLALDLQPAKRIELLFTRQRVAIRTQNYRSPIAMRNVKYYYAPLAHLAPAMAMICLSGERTAVIPANRSIDFIPSCFLINTTEAWYLQRVFQDRDFICNTLGSHSPPMMKIMHCLAVIVVSDEYDSRQNEWELSVVDDIVTVHLNAYDTSASIIPRNEESPNPTEINQMPTEPEKIMAVRLENQQSDGRTRHYKFYEIFIEHGTINGHESYAVQTFWGRINGPVSFQTKLVTTVKADAIRKFQTLRDAKLYTIGYHQVAEVIRNSTLNIVGR